ncbi:MAG: response regulator [Bacteroidia bacterium]|nr:fused response regulator/phosphatase [Bacteroidia bacterium]MDW8333173.1 response regulator [Bacteroidia bacterium]
MKSRKPIVLCVDDEPTVLTGLRDTLKEKLGDVCRVEASESPLEALEMLADMILEDEPVAAVISDQIMPQITGDELLTRVYRTDPRIRTILLTGQASGDAVGRALNDAGLYRYISKPWDVKDLILTVKEAVLSWEKGYELEARVAMLQELHQNVQTLSQIIEPEALAKEILAVSVKKTSADYGAMAFGGKLLVWEPMQVSSPAKREFPEAAARRAAETCRYVGLEEIDYGTRPRPADALCAPIVRLRQTLAVLYLENSRSLFDSVALEHLKLFLEQSAIFIENALMYQKLSDGINERTRALENAERALSQSLAYARFVQSALAPRQPEFSDHFCDSCLVYIPGKNPGGDGYWLVSEGNTVYFCVAEVTHPGMAAPFLALLGSAQLTDIVLQKRVETAGDILYFLHREVARMSAELGLKLGVNVVLCVYDKNERRVRFAGAALPLIHIRDDDYDLYPGDELPLGFNDGEVGLRLFREAEFSVAPGDVLLLATDAAFKIAGNADMKAGVENLARFFANPPVDQSLKKALMQRFFPEPAYDEDVLVLGVKL